MIAPSKGKKQHVGRAQFTWQILASQLKTLLKDGKALETPEDNLAAMRMSCTPRFLSSVNTCSQNFGSRGRLPFNVIDEGNREALRIECGSSIPVARFVRTTNQLIKVYGKPYAIRMDNWPKMTSEKFIEWAEEQGILLMLIQPGKSNKNAFIERFNRSFRDEILKPTCSIQLIKLKRLQMTGFRITTSTGRMSP